MLENINWNWPSIWVAVIFVLSAMIAGGAQIQIRDAIAFGKIEKEGSGCVTLLLSIFIWASFGMAGIILIAMFLGNAFNSISWWVAVAWLLFIMIRGNGVIQATKGPVTRIQPVAPREWQGLLIEKARTDPMLKKELAEVMWLDEYLMTAIGGNPSQEFPEMRQAWNLCLRIARKLGIPEQEGADWLSNNATSIGNQIGIFPIKPQSL